MSHEPALASDTKPLLLTLGQLKLSSNAFKQDKPLLLVAYLSLEGPKPRKFMAELFWPEAANPMNSLAVALKKLREASVAEADTVRVWATLDCDALTLREHLRSGRLTEAVELYAGSFAEGIATEEIGEELEEWLYSTREALASEVRSAWLSLAEQEAAAGRFVEAGAKAETAYRLNGAPPLEAEELIRLYRLLLAAEHPLREGVEREARDLEIALPQSAEATRGKLRQTLIGRRRELQTLLALEPGEWAWVRGGDGMGKTALLKELEAKSGWRYLPARSGLPFATLEPLVRDLEGGEEVVLRRLARQGHDLLLDDWEAMDPESQQVLGRLRTLRPEFRVVLSGRGEAAVAVDHRVELSTLGPEDLVGHVGAYEATDGVPGLVGAWLRMEPLEGALEARLAKLSQAARDLYSSLTLLETPDLSLARQALKMEAGALAQNFESLLGAGLVEASGQVRGRMAALNHLGGQPNTQAKLALALARHLKDEAALPLYRRAKALWEEVDLPRVQQAFLAWSKELLRRGYPLRAAETLDEAPAVPEVILLKARAFERAGDYKEALEVIEELISNTKATSPDSGEAYSLRSAIFFRLGELVAAEASARLALNGSLYAKAEARNTLGNVALATHKFVEAEQEFRRAASLWLAVGEEIRRIDALNNQAVARSYSGEHDEAAFQEALEAAKNHLPSRALILLNMARGYDRRHEFDKAIEVNKEAISCALESGSLQRAASAWNNLGTCFEHLGNKAEAKNAYENCLRLAEQIGDKRMVGLSMTHLAELYEDAEAWEESIQYLETAGFTTFAQRRRHALEQFMGNSRLAEHT